MASVTSLGLHQPTALEYAIQEQILPENPSSSLYTWEIVVNHEPGNEGEDELLVTKDTVIWSRGCIFRKSFGFKLEKEPITQALLTYFPNSEQDAKSPFDGIAPEPAETPRPLAKALVVFLKTQAHIYFLEGTSHVVHIPFEVESACAAPQGVIIQRKQSSDISLAASLKFPKVPPNSFISNQISPASIRASQQMPFTTETLGKPKALPLRLSTNIDNVWDVPTAKNDSHWPRLVSMTDPLLEIGLVVTKPDASTRRKGFKGSSRPPHVLDRAEEILHIEEIPQPTLSSKPENSKLTLAITLNRETSMYTVWRFSFIRHEDPFLAGRKKTRRKSDRRRSSMQPGLPSGATSPIQTNFKESFGATLPGKRSRKSEKVNKTDRALENLESSLGIDRDSGLNRRSSRRVSSMLARADLSASQDRTNFVDQSQTSEHPTTRRHTSHNSQRNRNSGVSFSGNHGHHGGSLVTFLEAPVDNLLEELRAGGDFEGFHNMGLDDHDFDGLAQEVMFTKVHSVSVDNSNVRYSLSKQPARKQCKVFCLAGPPSPADGQVRWQVLIGVQDLMEKRLQLLILHVQSSIADGKTSVNAGKLTKAQNVIDSCKVVDGGVSKLLVLSESHEGQRALSVQAPWSDWKTVTLPSKLSLANLRSLDYRGSLVNREIGIRRAVTPVVGEIAGIRHPKLRGVVDILDEDTNQLHQIRIQLEPTSAQVAKVLSILRAALPSAFGENLLVIWWNILEWLRSNDVDCADTEWSAVVILIMLVYLVLGVVHTSPLEPSSNHRRTRSFLRSSSGTQVDLSDWEAMNFYEAPNSSTHPAWAEGTAWQWMLEEDETSLTMFHPSSNREGSEFLVSHVKHALSCLHSAHGEQIAVHLPTAPNQDVSTRTQHAQDVFTALHLLLEELKLDTSSSQASSPGPANLRAVLLQIAQWMKWGSWLALYELEMPIDWPEHRPRAPAVTTCFPCPEPVHWSVLDWIATNLTQEKRTADLIATIPEHMSSASLQRIMIFKQLFEILSTGTKSPVEFVEAMHESGITPFILETLPEAIVVPLRDAIVQCQGNPPPTWSRKLLNLVNRSDVGAVFSASNRHASHTTNIPASQHMASWDFASLCQNVMDFQDNPADDVAESDKQAVIRAIFKEDRRLEEIKSMLNTTKPRVVRLDPMPEWTEQFYLEQQKELVTRLATNTLSIPVGRSLMNYGLRFPLLTQKFHINGFVLNCTLKPTNTTVGVDKTHFTEDKIAWAFFHSGVAGGLSISRQAKGIDTSWILYNKPGNDLNNRHAGFLLALGLNGHLKGVAKWVAFKYLTPKHTMTSIGLLLGLAASYIGTMDSLITRLLSVHVTRMLPRGAAELNLSPLTQTTGIMGIGLLYCNSQHRRMSEIMMSEVEHIESEDDEEPLRSECYRLAAGFALGFINLGKGADLKGLHDMRITEKLLTIASAAKKVEHVHILDRSSAAAIMAIALIYMKSEDHIVARKVDVPDAALQFDYIRPDLLLLRTVAKHLILWSEIKPTHDWVRHNLPPRYRSRVQPPTLPFDHGSRGHLHSTDLPFLTILAGLCFAIALRYAGSGDTRVRDVLLSYLHRLHGFCRNPTPKFNFDDRCVQMVARMCLDVVSLSCATVMAGTCDLKVLRILRSLHARSDPETTYGSHMATHIAIGVLSLGCGTQTFNTSNIAIGALLVAFYPVFPESVQDNKSHLQAFRHFWVLAADPRCLVTKDMANNAPVSVPVSIRLKPAPLSPPFFGSTAAVKERQLVRTTPCLLPPLEDILSIRTTSPEFWNLDLNFAANPQRADAFLKRCQSLYLRRRPVSDSPFAATMLALGRSSSPSLQHKYEDGDIDPQQSLEWIFDTVPALAKLTHAERAIVLDRGVGGPDVSDAAASVVDARLVLEQGVQSGRRDDLVALKGLFEWVEWRARRSQKDQSQGNGEGEGGGKDAATGESTKIDWNGEGWLRESVVEGLKGSLWLASRE
ncbi:Anaphase-promoting complex subunit 1 [Diatrype stigma]|uniref:Anaphase-promoting complex subunit 1 n=1 Tax=Diatrype stigma TaxID=117547 RepID=A0AAN9USW7_9PEZI